MLLRTKVVSVAAVCFLTATASTGSISDTHQPNRFLEISNRSVTSSSHPTTEVFNSDVLAQEGYPDVNPPSQKRSPGSITKRSYLSTFLERKEVEDNYKLGAKRTRELAERLRQCKETGCVDNAVPEFDSSTWEDDFNRQSATMDEIVHNTAVIKIKEKEEAHDRAARSLLYSMREQLFFGWHMRFQRRQLWPLTPDHFNDEEPILDCYISNDLGKMGGVVIILKMRLDDKDAEDPNEDQRDPSEDLFRLLKSVSGDISGIQLIIFHNTAINLDAMNTIRRARIALGVSSTDSIGFRSGFSGEMQKLEIRRDTQDTDRWAAALLGTRICDVVSGMLERYPNAMGFRRVHSVKNWLAETRQQEVDASNARYGDSVGMALNEETLKSRWGSFFVAMELGSYQLQAISQTETLTREECLEAGVKRRNALNARLRECRSVGCIDKAVTNWDWSDGYRMDDFGGDIKTIAQWQIEPAGWKADCIKQIFDNIGLSSNTLFHKRTLEVAEWDEEEQEMDYDGVLEIFLSVDEQAGKKVLIVPFIDFSLNPVVWERGDYPNEHLFKLLNTIRQRGTRIDNIEHVIQLDVRNSATMDLIRQTRQARRMGPTGEMHLLELDNGVRSDAMWVMTLTGSRNGKTFHRVLEDYPNAMGQRYINKVRDWIWDSGRREPDHWGVLQPVEYYALAWETRRPW